MEKLHRLYGMNDCRQEFWRQLRAAEDHLREYFTSHGYRVLETPVLELTELFLRKSGGELAARIYTFTDPGGSQVSLRPEYTASILRHHLEDDRHEPMPARFQYAGPVFRHDGESRGYRQFTQVGAELFGSSNPRADAEILFLSCEALSSLGISGHTLELGDLGVFYALLESLGLSERATAFILSSIGELKTGREGLGQALERAKQLGLLASGSQQTYLGTAIGDMDEDKARELLHGLLQWAEADALGQRQPSEVVERLLRKFRGTDDPARLEEGLSLAHQLAILKGNPESSIAQAEGVIRSAGLSPSGLDRLKEVVDLLQSCHQDPPSVVLDFGLARGLAYYTGIVFEIRHPSVVEASLGGGGRYDGLAKALGSVSRVPALGFAYILQNLLAALSPTDTSQGANNGTNRTLLVTANGNGAYREALSLARELRAEGKSVEMEVCSRSVEESIDYARARGIAEVIEVGVSGQATSHPVVSTSDANRVHDGGKLR